MNSKSGKHRVRTKLETRASELTERLDLQSVRSCYICRTCTSSCPVTFIDPRFNPLAILRMVLYGMVEEVLSSDFLWLCTSCYSCQERCPQEIPVADIMTKLKNKAFKLGNAPVGVKAQMDIIKKAGRIYPLDDFDNKKRAKAGLPELPTSCHVVKTLFESEAESLK